MFYQNVKIIVRKEPLTNGSSSAGAKRYSPYIEVKANACVAEFELENPEASFPLSLEGGLELVQKDDTLCVQTLHAGVLELGKKVLTLHKNLVIKGDVDKQTGNICLFCDIEVQGDIREGFSVECGGNLMIMGCIENGVQAQCAKNMLVERGIIGRNTDVKVSGSLKCSYIKDAKVCVGQNLEVQKFIIDSKTYCRGNINILGESVNARTCGAVAGGVLNSVGDMVLHSVGSMNSKTLIIAGEDSLALEYREKLSKQALYSRKRIKALRARLKLDPSSKDASEILSSMGAEERESCLKILSDIRELLFWNDRLHKELIESKHKIQKNQRKSSSIHIKNYSLGELKIRIAGVECSFPHEMKSAHFRVKNEEICED